jgi:hypothetical protein
MFVKRAASLRMSRRLTMESAHLFIISTAFGVLRFDLRYSTPTLPAVTLPRGA